MPDRVRIRVKPPIEEQTISFEELLDKPEIPDRDKERLRAGTIHEKYCRAEYHRKRYLSHLLDDELHRRIGYMIANVTYVSSRYRYSTNNLYSNYWRNKIAHAAEELAIRHCDRSINSSILNHLPALGFAIPAETVLRHDPRAGAFFRYDKLRYIRNLHKTGEIYLRCASTPNVAGDFARNDENELCIELRLLKDDIDLDFTPAARQPAEWRRIIELKMYQKTDYYMFCLTQGYDFRSFGDFSGGDSTQDAEDRTACQVIADREEFARRFASAANKFMEEKNRTSPHKFELSMNSAYYYDPYDSGECGPLFGDRDLLPFAKRHEYTYQHEFRFVIKPKVPDDYEPAYPPEEIPKYERDFLRLGNLEDISYIIEADRQTQETHKYYLSNKDINPLASAIAVTLPSLKNAKRFVYSTEKKEVGRTDADNLTAPRRFKGGPIQHHEQEIDIPEKEDQAGILHAINDFYRVFDIREHGNHLIVFKVYGDNPLGFLLCEYKAFLECSEPGDDKIEESSVLFEFKYSFFDQDKRIMQDTEVIEFEGHTYMAPNNAVGELHRHHTHRSLLIAEMEFIQRLIARGINELITYECWNREQAYPCSLFKSHLTSQHIVSIKAT